MSGARDRVAVVTGAASGNGEAIARRFFNDGGTVIIADVDEGRGAALAKELDSSGQRAVYANCDVSSAKDTKELGVLCRERFGAVDWLVNNAGIGRWGTVETTTLEDWEAVLAVNVRGVFLVSKYIVPLVPHEPSSSIVNIGSGAGLIGTSNSVAYCASKGAVVNMTRAMAIDLASAHIRVNCVCPGVVDTPFNARIVREAADPDALLAAQVNAHPLGRLAVPDDVAGAVAFLCSRDAAFMTGAIVTVDGGLTAQ
jgi:NAD(P)-dependent dehydrogenase (short-subunit alcohol dehydrogenase family)